MFGKYRLLEFRVEHITALLHVLEYPSVLQTEDHVRQILNQHVLFFG